MAFSFGNMKKRQLRSLQHFNEIHSSIKFTAEWSQTSINFLDVTISIISGKARTDFYIQPTDSHQHLHSSSCHPHNYKKAIPQSKPRLDRICSVPNSFIRRCKALDKWLIEKGYNKQQVRKQILRAGFSRDYLLGRENTREDLI